MIKVEDEALANVLTVDIRNMWLILRSVELADFLVYGLWKSCRRKRKWQAQVSQLSTSRNVESFCPSVVIYLPASAAGRLLELSARV